ncbi:MAG: tripartite tricarboxylate transporter TctB family protein [Sulfolobales archaeon]
MGVYGEIIVFLSLLISSSYLLYEALKLPKLPFVVIGPEVWPSILLIGIIISCISAVVYRYVRKNYYRPPKLGRDGLIRVLTTIMFIVIYALVFEYIGFFISTLLLIPIYLKFLRVKTLTSLVVGFIFAMLALLLFPVFLLIPLPRGYGVFYDLTTYILGLFGR